jgi:thioredoxin 2
MATATESVLVRCPACGAMNRVRPDRAAGAAPVCGRCKASLPEVSAGPIDVSDATFAQEVERSDVPVLVDLWAPWCGPCRMLAPTLEQIAAEFGGRAKVAKLNIDENPAVTARLGVGSIPTLVVFKDGREVQRLVGLRGRDEIARALQSQI